jgi:hypothetical protein
MWRYRRLRWIANHLLQLFRDLLGPVGLGKKHATRKHVFLGRLHVAGRHDDLHGRPVLTHVLSKLETVHRARHINVGEDGTNIFPPFEQSNGFVSLCRGFTAAYPASSRKAVASILISGSSSTTRMAALVDFMLPMKAQAWGCQISS